ncbi:hypothetical protein NM208_g12356 [Fusarium decemcellulare]|uniref:Uncharacterized protein n=1 Tax=Fusarium decemcellulare TaxID=57161 RepID=A0ACC1RSI8_9HYPO|nr:hypothetical protein NM208_g12356 [Fusarium decemcellulare]
MERVRKLKNKLHFSRFDTEPAAQQPSAPSTTSAAQPTNPTTLGTSATLLATADSAAQLTAPPPAQPESTSITRPETPLASRPTTSHETPPSSSTDTGPALLKPDIVNAYEEILNKVQLEWATETDPSKMEELEQCKGTQSRQMWRLVYTGLERSKKQVKLKDSVSTGFETVENIKGVINKAIKASPEAGVVWAGVSLGLEILSNPMKEPGLNRKGIAHVSSRMEWYWNLSDVILDADRANPSYTRLRSNLESQVVEFYKKLLLFQMQSACLYYRNWASVLLRDAVKLDDWAEKLKEVKDAESSIRHDFEQYNSEEMKAWIDGVHKASESQEALLESIYLTIRQEVRRQERKDEEERDAKNGECFAAFELTDPQLDKKTLQSRKGTPLWDSYRWVLKHDAYEKLVDDPSSRVLWISGEPGKGKTMLLCGIIDELEKSPRPLSYFFCQVTEPNLSSDTAVMRGLIYVLLDHQPSLISVVRPYYDKKKEKLFDSANSSVLLGEILTNMLQDASLHDAFLVVDALDECKVGRDRLTKLIVGLSSSCRAKWIVSSRRWPEIGRELTDAQGLIPLELEKNRESVTEAVQSYIRTRVSGLAKNWDNDTNLKDKVSKYMVSHADNTFLWVALVCGKLADLRISKRLVLEELGRFPKGLTDLFNIMMERILTSSEADRLKTVLATACVAYRPLTWEEMTTLVESMEKYDENDVEDVIKSCGSFLTYRDGVIYFIHQSAKEFLLKQGGGQIISHGVQHQHSRILSRSLTVLERDLKQDIYHLGSLGTLINEVSRPDPDPLSPIKYLCVHWADHLIDSNSVGNQDWKILDLAFRFLQEKFIFWVEALSLLRLLSVAITSIMKLDSALTSVETKDLTDFVWDARRFLLCHKEAIEMAPLQIYVSALVFSPRCSKVREQNDWKIPKWILAKPDMLDNWDSRLQMLRTLDDGCIALSYSPDGRLLASASYWEVVVHDTTSGDCVYSIKKPLRYPKSAVFSPTGNHLAVAYKEEVDVFQVGTFDCIQNFEFRADQVVFSPIDGQLGILRYETTEVWNWKTGESVQTLTGHTDHIISATFLPSGRMVTGSDDGTAKIWNVATGDCEQTLHGHDDRVNSVACSSDGELLATGSYDCTIKVWHLATTGVWICKQTLDHPEIVVSVSFSAHGRMLISASEEYCIRIWNSAGTCVKILHGHTDWLACFSTCKNGQWLASGSQDGYVALWDISDVSLSQIGKAGSALQELDDKSPQQHKKELPRFSDGGITRIQDLGFSPDGQMVVSHLMNSETMIWNVTKESYLMNNNRPVSYYLLAPSNTFNYIAFSRNDQLVALPEEHGKVVVWDLPTDKRTPLPLPPHFSIDLIALSPNGKYAATVGSMKPTVSIWNLTGRQPMKQSELQHKCNVNDILFSNDSKVLATAFEHGDIKVWDIDSGNCLEVIRGSQGQAPLAFSLDSQGLLTHVPESLRNRRLKSIGGYFPTKRYLGQSDASSSSSSPTRGTGSQLVTPFGILEPDKLSKSGDITRIGWGLSFDERWLMRGDERVLWIPVEYPVAVDAVRSRVAIGLPSGEITMMQLE